LIGLAGNTDVTSFAALETSIVCDSGSLAYQPFTSLAPFLLSAGDASKTVLVCLKDAAGNTSTVAASDAINLDTAQPVGSAVAIVDGDGFLQAEAAANLTVSWTSAGDVTQVKTGEGAVDCSSPQGYSAVSGTSTTIGNFPLSSGDGTKLVIACLKDAAGNIATAQDTSLRDNTRPTVTNVACTTCTSDGTTTFSVSSAVTLALSSDESGSGLREARVAVDAGAESVAVLTNGTLAVNGLSGGTHVLHVKATDNAGNTSTTPRDLTLTIDGTAPVLAQLLLNDSAAAGNATVSRTINVSIVGASTDTAAMSVAEVDGNGPAIASCAAAVYAPFVPSFTRTLPAVDGVKAVSVCLQDRAGNKSASAQTTTIRLDTTVPSLVANAVVIQDGGDNFLTTVSGGVSVQLNWSTVGDVAAFKLGENSVDCSSEPYVRPANIATVNTFAQPGVSLSTLDGTKVVVVCFKDAAGNVTSSQDTTVLDQVGPNGALLADGGADFFTNAAEDVVVTARMSTDVARFAVSETTAANPTCASPTVNCALATYQVFSGSVVDGVLIASKTINLAGAPAAENLKCFEGCFEDAAGNRSTTATTDALTFDKSAPAVGAGGITLTGADKLGPSSTLTRTPFITVAVAGAPADTASYRVSEDGGFAGGTQAFVAFTSSTTPFALSPGDALKTVSVQLKDAAGNVGSVTTKSITLDATGPQSASVSIEAGAAFTRLLTPNTATFGTTGASEMQIAVDGVAGSFVTFASSAAVAFAGVDGTKTVSVVFRDDAGNTAAASDTIVLDRAAPAGGTVVINGGSAVTNSTTVTLTLTPPADAVDMSVGGAAFVPVTSTILAAIAGGDCSPAGNACKSVAVIFRDAAGNAQGTGASDTIELDTTPPSSTSLALASIVGADAAGFTTGGTVNVTFGYATGAGQATSVKHGEGAVDCSGTTGFIALDGTSPDVATNVVLSSSEGTKSYSACFKDAAGNITSSSSSIIADRVRPSGVVSVAGGDSVVASLGPNSVTIIAADDVNRMSVSANVLNCATATYVTFASPTNVTFTGADGQKTAHVCLQDAAGNVTQSEVTDDVVVDTTDPVATLTIAEGTSVNTLDITLEIDPTTADVVEMAARELVTLDCDSSGTSYDPFSASSTFFLAAGSDGPRDLAVCLRDAIGNTTLLTQTITLDRLVPVGTLALTTTNGFVLVSSVSASASVTSEGAVFPAGFSVKSGEGVNCADAGGYSAASGSTTAFSLGTVTLAAGEGGHTVTTCLKDAAGNIGTAAAGLNVDLTAPLNLGVRCSSCVVDSGGNLFSSTTAPKIAVEAQDPNPNGFVKDVGITVGAGAETFTAFDDEVTATLAGTQTLQAVSVRFRDAAGRLSPPFALNITLDSVVPSATLVTTGVAAAGPSTTLTRNPNVKITLAAASADITQLMVSEDPNFVGAAFVPFANPGSAQTFLLLSQGDGGKTVSARIRDRAGNEVLLAVPPAITLDTQAPTNATTLIAAGAERTTVNNPAVTFTAVGATQLSIITPDGAAGTGFATVTFPRTQAVVIEDLAGSANDGTKTVLGVFRDDAGNEAAAASDSILLDRELPVATSVSVNNAATFTNSISVGVGVVGSGADFMQISVDGVADEAFVAFDANASATLVPGSCPANVCTVSVCLKDLAGNVSSPCRSDTITLDTVAPSGLLLSLEGGAVTTRDGRPAATLTYATGATEAAQFVLGEGINCETSTFANVSGTSPQIIADALTLSAGDGLKSVTACFKDAAGNIASVVDQVNLDTTAPAGITIAVAGGASKTNLLTNIPIAVTLPPGLVDVALIAVADRTSTGTPLNCTTPQAPASYVAFTGSATLGAWLTTDNVTPKDVQACFQDSVGNTTSASVSDLIRLDNTLPTATLTLTGTIRTGASSTLTRNPVITVDLSAEAVDIVEMRIANESSFTGVAFSSALPLANNAKSFTLSGGDGVKSVFVEIKDDAGNVTQLSRDITLDTTAPLAPAITLKDGDLFSRLTALPLALTVIAQPDDGALQVAIDINGDADFADVGDIAFTTTFPGSVNLTAGEGLRTVFAKFRDLAGNETIVVNDQITIDTSPPCAGGSSGSISTGASFADDVVVTVGGTCSGEIPTRMRVNCDSTTATTADIVPFQPTFTCVLNGSTQGTKNVAVDFLDNADNVRTPASDAITLDDIPPSSPVLTLPGTVSSGVNFACARSDTNVTSTDTNFSRVQARVNGGAFVTCSSGTVNPGTISGCFHNTSTSKVSVNLGQDRDNLVEIRVLDLAGNIGEASSVIVPEISSAFVSTPLTVKAVCGGEYMILKDFSSQPTSTAGPDSVGDGVFLVSKPAIDLVELDTMLEFQFSGPGGLASNLGGIQNAFGISDDDWGLVIDAHCTPDSDKILFAYWGDTGDQANFGSPHIVVWEDPRGDDLFEGPDRLSGTFSPNRFEALTWEAPGTPSNRDFRASAVSDVLNFFGFGNETLHQVVNSGGTVTVSAAYETLTENSSSDTHPLIHGLGTSAVSGQMTYTLFNGTNWVLRHKTSSGGTLTSMFTASGAITQTSPWHGVLIKQGAYAHRSSVVAHNWEMVDSAGDIRQGTAIDTNLVTIQGDAGALKNFYDRSADNYGWPDATQANRVINATLFTAGTPTQEYRLPIDQTRPMLGTGRSAAGAPVVVYHTAGSAVGVGVVVARSDQSGCFNN
jgi:hypothetical protein